jgi:uncharacterized membrane protein YqgA involved in biofilm formation
MSKSIILWTLFALTSVLTVLSYKLAWSLSAYWTLLFCLGLLSLLFAILVLLHAGPKPWSITAVVAGLLIGQWWFVEMMAVRLIWALRGFAP